jgi:hypothetical protein
LTKRRKKMKRNNPETRKRTEIAGNAKEIVIIPKKRYKGKKKTEKAVMSARILATRKVLGVIGEVKIKLCSYSNTTYPRKVEIRTNAKTLEIRAET